MIGLLDYKTKAAGTRGVRRLVRTRCVRCDGSDLFGGHDGFLAGEAGGLFVFADVAHGFVERAVASAEGFVPPHALDHLIGGGVKGGDAGGEGIARGGDGGLGGGEGRVGVPRGLGEGFVGGDGVAVDGFGGGELFPSADQLVGARRDGLGGQWHERGGMSFYRGNPSELPKEYPYAYETNSICR